MNEDEPKKGFNWLGWGVIAFIPICGLAGALSGDSTSGPRYWFAGIVLGIAFLVIFAGIAIWIGGGIRKAGRIINSLDPGEPQAVVPSSAEREVAQMRRTAEDAKGD